MFPQGQHHSWWRITRGHYHSEVQGHTTSTCAKPLAAVLVSHLSLTTTRRSLTEAQRGSITCPKSNSWELTICGTESKDLYGRSCWCISYITPLIWTRRVGGAQHSRLGCKPSVSQGSTTMRGGLHIYLNAERLLRGIPFVGK